MTIFSKNLGEAMASLAPPGYAYACLVRRHLLRQRTRHLSAELPGMKAFYRSQWCWSWDSFVMGFTRFWCV